MGKQYWLCSFTRTIIIVREIAHCIEIPRSTCSIHVYIVYGSTVFFKTSNWDCGMEAIVSCIGSFLRLEGVVFVTVEMIASYVHLIVTVEAAAFTANRVQPTVTTSLFAATRRESEKSKHLTLSY